MKKNIKLLISIFSILFLFITSISLSYSYFVSEGEKSESQSTIYAQGATLSITYESADIIFKSKIYPREEEWATKTFTVTGDNTSPLKMNYYAGMDVEASNFPDGALTYTLNGSKEDTGSTLIPNVTSGSIPGGKSKVYFGIGQFVKGTAVHTYVLKIFYPDLDIVQNDEQGSSFKAKLFIEQAGTGELTNKQLDKIELTTKPSKLTYISGENFDPTGMVITAYYTDGTNKTVTNYELSDNLNLKTGQNLIRISYTEDLITRTVTLAVNATNSLTGITISNPPSKTTYIAGENFDSTGMEVTASYQNGTSKVVTGYRVSNNKNLVKGQTYVTVIYSENGETKSAKQTITVTNDMTGILVTAPPNKTTYSVGETFDSTGMIISAKYQNGSTQVITGYTITDGTITEGQTYVTISYKDTATSKTFTTTQNIFIGTAAKTLQSISITTPPTKIVYAPSTAFQTEGMVVTAHYSDGTSKEVTDYTVTNGSSLTSSQTSVTISYTENDITVTTTQDITIDGQGPTITLTETPTYNNSSSTTWAKSVTISGTASDVSGVSTTKYCSTTSTTCTPTNTLSNATSFSLSIGNTSSAIRYCFQSTDKLGNSSAVKCSTAYKVDSVSPSGSSAIASSSQNAAKTWYKSLSISITGTDSVSGINNIKYCITTSTTCTPSTTYTSAISLSSNTSAQKICYKVTDNAYNVSSTTCTSSYKVDTTAPTAVVNTPTTVAGTYGWYKSVQLNFGITEKVSGVASLKYCLTTSSTCTPTTAYTGFTSGTTSLTSYTYTLPNTATAQRLCIQVTDVADNASSVVCSDAYSIDSTVPTVTGSAVTSGYNNGWYKSVGYQATASETYSGIYAMYYCTTASSSCVPSTAYTSGTYIYGSGSSIKFCFNAVDWAGNTSSTHCSGSYNIDTVPPIIYDGVKSGTNIVTDVIDNESGVAYSCLSTSSTSCTGGWNAFSSYSNVTQATYSISTAGSYYVHFRDAVGNESYSSKAVTFTCNTSSAEIAPYIYYTRTFKNGSLDTSMSINQINDGGGYVFAGYTGGNIYVGQGSISVTSPACYWRMYFPGAGTDNTNGETNIAVTLDNNDDSSLYQLKGDYGSAAYNRKNAYFRIGLAVISSDCGVNTACFSASLPAGTRYLYLYHNSMATSYNNNASYSSLWVGGESEGHGVIRYRTLS